MSGSTKETIKKVTYDWPGGKCLTIGYAPEAYLEKQFRLFRQVAEQKEWFNSPTNKDAERAKAHLLEKNICHERSDLTPHLPSHHDLCALHLALLEKYHSMHCGEATAFSIEKFLKQGANNFLQFIITKDSLDIGTNHSFLVFFKDMTVHQKLLKLQQEAYPRARKLGELLNIDGLFIFDLSLNRVGPSKTVMNRYNLDRQVTCSYGGYAFDLDRIGELKGKYLADFERVFPSKKAADSVVGSGSGSCAGAGKETPKAEPRIELPPPSLETPKAADYLELIRRTPAGQTALLFDASAGQKIQQTPAALDDTVPSF